MPRNKDALLADETMTARSLRWALLGWMATEFPAEMETLRKALPLYEALGECRGTYHAAVTVSDEEAQEHARELSGPLTKALDKWTASLGLAGYRWAYDHAVWLLRALLPPSSHTGLYAALLDVYPSRGKASFREMCEDLARGERLVFGNDWEGERPAPPPLEDWHGLFETWEKYQARQLEKMEQYRAAVLEWHALNGSEVFNKPELQKHLRWLTWHLVKDWSYSKIAGELQLEGTNLGATAVFSALKDLAPRIGVRLRNVQSKRPRLTESKQL